MPPFAYHLYGLTIASDIELPELACADGAETPDVSITLGKVAKLPQSGGQPQSVNGGMTIDIPDIARFAVRDGRSIVIEADAAALPGNVRLFLLGSAMGMLLHQAGLLPLHANVIGIDGRAIAFMGASGSGKSTLAAWFHDRGHRVISDDVCVIRFDDAGQARVGPGLPRLRLWREAVVASGRDPAAFAASYSGDPSYDKFDVPTGHAEPDNPSYELAAIYQLGEAAARGFAPIRGGRAVEALISHIYRGAYAALADQSPLLFRACIELARRVPLFGFARPLDLDTLDEDIAAIVEHVRATGPSLR